MTSLYIRIGIFALLAVSCFATGYKVSSWRHDSVAYGLQQAAEKASQAATEAAVAQIKQLRPQFHYVTNEIQRETQTEVRYRECVHTPAAWGLLDDAYQAAGGEPFGSGTGLPAPPAP